jgi:hypothetical protein
VTRCPRVLAYGIRREKLFGEAEIDEIVATAPTQLVAFQKSVASLPLEARPHLSDWLSRFNANAWEAV